MSKKWIIIALCFGVYLLTLLLNPGFMGTDEYWTGITRYVPAQTQNYSNMMKDDDVKSPTQIIPLVWSSHLALKFGIESPYWQYRFVQFFLGLTGLILLFWGIYHYLNEKEKLWAFGVFAFYFAAPFALTRPMYESLSAPFVLLSALSLKKYFETHSRKQVLFSTLMISLAFALRPQTGIAALAIPLFTLIRKDTQAFWQSSLLGALLFALLGVPDLIIRGSWHYSLKAILFYNVQYGASYAQQPWFFYILLSLGLLWAPFWISKHFIPVFKKHFKSQKIFWFYIVLILGLHSFFPQKWERFIIPVLPLMLLILANWVQSFWELGNRKRLYALGAINLIAWAPASFFPAQQNIISLSLYLDQTPEAQTLYRLNKNPEWITEAFIRRSNWQWVDIQEPPPKSTCSSRLVMNQKDYESQTFPQWELESIFETNWIEKWAYKMNPSKNLRRTPLYLLKPVGCKQHLE